MVKKTTLAIACSTLLMTGIATADTLPEGMTAGVHYLSLKDSDDGDSISLGGALLSVGYRMGSDSSWTTTPQFRYGIGLSDDDLYGFDVELSQFLAASVRFENSFDNGMYLYLAPAYANAEFEVSYGGSSEKDDDWEFGGGAGIGYQMTEGSTAEISYESFGGTDAIAAGITFNF